MSETIADVAAEMRRFGQRHWMHDEGQNIRLYADRIEAAAKRDYEYPKAQSLDADKLTGKNISGLATDLRQIAKYHYARGNVEQGQFARVMADRIEAAAKRDEEHAVEHATRHAEAVARDNCRDCIYNPAGKNYECGNAAAMREALETVRKYVKETTPDKVMLDVIEVWCNEALAKPMRNCDRFNSGDCNKDVVDASLAWDKFCAENYPPGTPVVPKTPYTFWSWVFAPATQKGENDGSK